jgi:DNA-binding NarL/FixJ family response regulator
VNQIRILVVSEHFDMMRGICALLNLESDFQLVGDVKNSMMGVHMAEALSPDVMLLDANNTVDTIEKIRRTSPHTQIIAFSSQSTAARAAGAFACLLPDILDPTNICGLIRRACDTDPLQPA